MMRPTLLRFLSLLVLAFSVKCDKIKPVDSLGACFNGQCGPTHKCIDGLCRKKTDEEIRNDQTHDRRRRDTLPMCLSGNEATSLCNEPNQCGGGSNYCCGETGFFCETQPQTGLNLCCDTRSVSRYQQTEPALNMMNSYWPLQPPRQPITGGYQIGSQQQCLPPQCWPPTPVQPVYPVQSVQPVQPVQPVHPVQPVKPIGEACLQQFIPQFQQNLFLCPIGKICLNGRCIPGRCEAIPITPPTNQNPCPPGYVQTGPCSGGYYNTQCSICIAGQCCEPQNINPAGCSIEACSNPLTASINSCCYKLRRRRR